MILDADGLAAEFIGEAEGGDVGFALPQHLLAREFGFCIGAEVELHAFFDEPIEDRARLVVADLSGAVVKS